MWGPVLARELQTAPRSPRLFVARALYGTGLLVLLCTAWMLVTGNQVIRNIGDLALFGTLVFQFLAPLQLVLVLLFSGLLAAGAVAQEKDRGTLSLLLMTRLTAGELVLGKLGASLLQVLVLLVSAVPFFLLLSLLGGFSFRQVLQVFAITLCTALAAGSVGILLAFWREKTFQTLALTVLTLVGWIAIGEVLANQLLPGMANIDAVTLATCATPLRALAEAIAVSRETSDVLGALGAKTLLFVGGTLAVAVLLNLITMFGLRAWNTAGGIRRAADPNEQESILEKPELAAEAKAKPARGADKLGSPKNIVRGGHVWNNPILWRELNTWAYGRTVLAVRGVFALLVLACAIGLLSAAGPPSNLQRVSVSLVLAPLLLVSLVLINALAVNSFCNERDGGTLDLLLATDLTPRELLVGKLIGIFYNSKEVLLLPLALCVLVATFRDVHSAFVLTTEELIYLILGFAVLAGFVAVLGIHAGMSYRNSRSAMAVSLGTVIFLGIGSAACMRLLIAFGSSFQLQFYPFAAFMLGGGLALFAALGVRNPSPAIAITAFLSPVATFYAITSFLLNQPHLVFGVTVFTYGFATTSLLVPALSEFDVALGRTTADAES